MREVLVRPELKARLLDRGIGASPRMPAECAEWLKSDNARQSAVIDRAGLPKQYKRQDHDQ